MSDLHELSALEQVRGMRAGEVSPRDLVEHYLDRIDRHDATLGTFITVIGDEAREAAVAAERMLAKTGVEALPRLFGLPIAIKDLHPTAGIRTTMGSAAFADLVPDADGVAVGAIRRAGAIVLGKTHAPEFGPCCYTQSDLVPEAVTPYDLTRSASGSSGGSAAAVAAGLVGLAHASDGLGSVRTPAANCGLVGLKPSRGRVSAPVPSFISLGIEGPVARTVADAALLLDVMAEPNPGDLYSAPPLAPDAFSVAAATEPRRLRIARYSHPGFDVRVNPQCLSAFERASELLEDLGHHVTDIDHPLGPTGIQDLLEPILSLLGVRMVMAVRAMVPPDRRELLRPLTKFFVELGEHVGGAQYGAAISQLESVTSSTLRAFAPYDAVLTPTTTDLPMPCGTFRMDDGREAAGAMLGWSAFTPLANLTGQPAVSLPL
ncbi:MAG: amidase, partial [Actinobacteria bacterium]|nr:amidase [Actinomycetota bacterium]